MNSVIIWAILLAIWIILGIYYVKRDRPTFWVCWAFFFIGWTVAMLLNEIGELIH